MPYKDPQAQRLANAQKQRRYRARQKAKRETAAARVVEYPVPPDPVGALVEWSRDVLRVPVGHPAAGEPMELPDYAVRFLRDGWNAHESACAVSRKNAKSASLAVLVLGYLVGPLRSPGWRGAVASLSVAKADELRTQVEAIAKASGLDELRFRRSPYPGKILSETGTLECLSSDRTAGHASSFDLVVCDETGLFPVNARELLAGLRSSVSAKGGRIIHISVRGDSDLYREVLENPETIAHVYEAPADCDLFDRKGWAAANPTLGVIKSVDYMEAEARRVSHVPSDEASFRAFDLNARLDPTREMIMLPTELQRCFVEPDALPPREGEVVIGLDAGEASSATSAFCIWPANGRVETLMSFGDIPSLRDRGRHDGAPYETMMDRGELTVYPGRIVPLADFLSDLSLGLEGSRVTALVSDGYKDAEVKDFLDRAGLRWPYEARRVGQGRDGSRDVRCFQRLVLTAKLRMVENLSLVSAIANSTLRRDENGNPALSKAKSRGRIDVLSAGIISAGLAEPLMGRKPRRWTYTSVYT